MRRPKPELRRVDIYLDDKEAQASTMASLLALAERYVAEGKLPPTAVMPRDPSLDARLDADT